LSLRRDKFRDGFDLAHGAPAEQALPWMPKGAPDDCWRGQRPKRLFWRRPLRLTERALLGLRALALLTKTGQAWTVDEIAALTTAPREHVSKVVHALAHHHLVLTKRGRNGGVRARPGSPVLPSQVIEALEPCLPRRDCAPCPLVISCPLPLLFGPATEAYLHALDTTGLAVFLPSRDDRSKGRGQEGG
jgi:Rrf2 family transcriptional regulator, nitric oxide-sensitive transcriptional repressor